MQQREGKRGDEQHSRGAGAREARHEPRHAAAEPEYDQRVQQEQSERRKQDRAAQILRLGLAVDFLGCVPKRGKINWREPIVSRQRVHGEEFSGGP